MAKEPSPEETRDALERINTQLVKLNDNMREFNRVMQESNDLQRKQIAARQPRTRGGPG